MANSYYSSDEEVAWGPLTLEEIKKDLSEPKKITRRETDFGTFFTPQSTFCMDKDAEDCVKTDSGASAYFTPNDSLQPESVVSSDKNSLFLEQLSRIIEDEKCSSVESPSTGGKNDTIMKILERGNNCDNLDNVRQTLIENTIRESHVELESSDDENPDVIVISDDSYTSDGEPTFEPIISCVKMEKECSQIIEELSLNETENRIDCENPDLESTLSSHESFNMSAQNASEDEINEESHDNVNCNTKISCSSESESSVKSASLVFNDTIEEMEMALRQGLDYVMPGEDSLPKSPPTAKPEQTFIPRPKKLKTPNKFDYIQSPIGDYIRRKSPVCDFKQPSRPVKTRATPNSKSPQVHVKQFKNIVSPVGVYIKNTPTCLKQNMPVKTVPQIKLCADNSTKFSSQSSIPLPEVVYKPGKKVVMSVKKDVNLPKNIQKMVLEPVIMKHEGRQGNMDKSGIAKKLMDGDLTTINSSVLDQDVSFVKIKQAYIK